MVTGEERANLVMTSVEIRRRAYAPYSHYLVGAALLTDTGKVFTGINIENAAFPVTVCAERVAIFKAISEGEKNFRAIAVATTNGGFPCGSCRQVMAEFGLDTTVIIADERGNVSAEMTVRDLLPGAFTPDSLTA
jgi:cytidine deaminase